MRYLFALLLLVPHAALAQETDSQLWLQAVGSAPVSEDVRVGVETIGRFSDNADGFSHSEMGVFTTYKPNKNVELLFGYRHVEDWNHGVALPNEERFRQQATITIGAGFAGRLRFEQRFNSRGPGIAFRLRPQIRFNQPIGGGFGIYATQEHYLNLNATDWGQRSGYSRIRNAFGLTVPVAKKITADIGYLNQVDFGRAGARDKMANALTMALTAAF